MTDKPTPNEDDTLLPPSATTTAPQSEGAPEAAETDQPTPAETEHPGENGQDDASAQAEPPRPKRALRWKPLCIDAALVLLLLAVLGTTAYYFHLTVNRYHVPTPMELMLSEGEELDRRFNELLPKANRADAQLHLRARLAQLEVKAARLSSQIAEKKAALDEQHGRVLAMQYAIRQADETNRGIARSLLPGMPVGTVTTTTGKAYRNATIYRLDKRYIYIRFPEGQVRFPLRHLVKDNLPALARYAFGQLDLVDMSDFEQTGDTPAPAQTHNQRPLYRSTTPTPTEQGGYDPAPGAPVLDTDANNTTTSRVPEEGSTPEQDIWNAPSGELPM